MIIAVDFDGTIVGHRFPEVGEEVPGAIQWMKEWQRLGAKIILWTERSNKRKAPYGSYLADAVRWLHDRGVWEYGVNENPGQSSWSDSPKAYAAVYVDDAAFGCPLIHPAGFSRPCVDWDKVGPAVADKIVTWKELQHVRHH